MFADGSSDGCPVLGLSVASLPWSLPPVGPRALRAPTTRLHACARCSVLSIHHPDHPSALLRRPRWATGARSGLLFLIPDCACAPVSGGLDEAEAATKAAHWNAAAAAVAADYADRYGLTGEARAAWLARLA